MTVEVKVQRLCYCDRCGHLLEQGDIDSNRFYTDLLGCLGSALKGGANTERAILDKFGENVKYLLSMSEDGSVASPEFMAAIKRNPHAKVAESQAVFNHLCDDCRDTISQLFSEISYEITDEQCVLTDDAPEVVEHGGEEYTEEEYPDDDDYEPDMPTELPGE